MIWDSGGGNIFVGTDGGKRFKLQLFEMLQDRPITFVPNDLPRKWLMDEALELIIWYSDQEIAGFELVYDRNLDEHSLRWLKSSGFQHSQIDSGEDESGHDQTPILISRGIFPKDRIRGEFLARSEALPEELRGFILRKLEEYSENTEG